jgi:DNA repair protein RadD
MLRPHQEVAVEALRQSLRKGKMRPLLAAPCSMGKTMIAAHIMMNAAEKGIRSVFFCDRVKLVSQTTDTFDRLGASYSVLQGDDPRYDPNCLIQIASIQTAVRRNHLTFGLAIVDECHTMYKGLVEGFMKRYDNVPFIGLSATPFSKGLGLHWDDLIVTTTTRQLLDKGWLCPTDYYVGKSIDRKGIKTKALSTGGSDYDPEALGKAMMDDETFNGDIVENYRKHSNDLQRKAIAFSPSVAHSKSMVERFNAAGIPALHIDGYMGDEERKYIYDDHRSGRCKVLCCSRLLGVGYDDPSVEILIDCFPPRAR